MSETLTLLVLGYIFLLAMLLLVVTRGRLHWLAKLALVTISVGFYLLSYSAWKQVQGWPSGVEPPDRFLLHASVIEEPDEESGDAGRIFVWLSDLEGNKPAGEPRAFELAYDRELHSALEDALRNQRNGNLQIGSKQHDRVAREGAPINVRQLGERHLSFKFSNLPDPALPEK